MPAAIPIVLAVTALAGVGMQVYAAQQQKQAGQKAAEANADIARQEQQAAALQKQQADLEAQRYRMQVVRQQNVARGLALSNATTGGAQYGSGLSGGYGQISGEAGNQFLNSEQNQGIANSLYGVNQNISGLHIAQAGYNSQYYSGAGMSSLGGALINSMGPIGRLSGFAGSSGFESYTPRQMAQAGTGRGIY